MKTIAANLTTLFWGIVYGEIIGYIGSAWCNQPLLKQLPLTLLSSVV
ncbi:DUF2929 family protein [Fructilactobacillus florum]|nr:DUF2929 family protein [Fructilactobacillus florum]